MHAVRAINKFNKVVQEIDSNTSVDLLRTKLRQNKQLVNIGIVPITTGCGASYIATHLALSLSKVKNTTTVLMDFNLRKPSLDTQFSCDYTIDLENFLDSNESVYNYLIQYSNTLYLGLNSFKCVNASEVLQQKDIQLKIDDIYDVLSPDIVLYDLPAILEYDDAIGFSSNLDGVILVANGLKTTKNEVLQAEQMLIDCNTSLIGVVLNEARK